MKIGTHTPWGYADHVSELAPGITFVATPSHGGIKLESWREEEMPASLRKRDFRYCPRGWYEEDCEITLVILAFPEIFRKLGYHVDYAEEMLRQTYPAQYAEWVAE